jgi:hypothetical protein
LAFRGSAGCFGGEGSFLPSLKGCLGSSLAPDRDKTVVWLMQSPHLPRFRAYITAFLLVKHDSTILAATSLGRLWVIPRALRFLRWIIGRSEGGRSQAGLLIRVTGPEMGVFGSGRVAQVRVGPVGRVSEDEDQSPDNAKSFKWAHRHPEEDYGGMRALNSENSSCRLQIIHDRSPLCPGSGPTISRLYLGREH